METELVMTSTEELEKAVAIELKNDEDKDLAVLLADTELICGFNV